MNSTTNTAFDLSTYVPVIDWKATPASVELSRAATARRDRAMASEDLNVRLAALGSIPGMGASTESNHLRITRSNSKV